MIQCLPVRQVIPVIRGNDTAGTPFATNTNPRGRKKRATDGKEYPDGVNPEFFQQPEFVRKTNRAVKHVRKSVLRSRILNKKLRFLRAVGLMEEKNRRKRAIVPRVSRPTVVNPTTNKKTSFVPRFLELPKLSKRFC